MFEEDCVWNGLFVSELAFIDMFSSVEHSSMVVERDQRVSVGPVRISKLAVITQECMSIIPSMLTSSQQLHT